MMKQSAGLVLTTLNGFVIVGLEIVDVFDVFHSLHVGSSVFFRHA